MSEHIILTLPHNYRETRAIFILILIMLVYILKDVIGYQILYKHIKLTLTNNYSETRAIFILISILFVYI